jgi:predicted ArsR family transcriptional regulator
MLINNKEYFTVKEMAVKIGITTNTAKHRIFELGLKPVSKDALYDSSVLEILRNVPNRGRPKKTPPEPVKSARKNRKSK